MKTDSTAILRAGARRLAVTQYLAPRDFLAALYAAAKAEVDGYSYLQFAADLGFSATNVVRLIIAGRRTLTTKAAVKIAKALDLHGDDRRYWSTLVKYANAKLPATRDALFRLLIGLKTRSHPTVLDQVQAEYFGEWFHPVIREMTALADFSGDPAWIQARLAFPLRLEQIKRSLALLAKIGVITYDEQLGCYGRTAGVVSTDSEVDSLAIVRYHQKMIEIGRESLTSIPEDRRDVRAVTVTLPQAMVPLLKGKIEEWIASVAAMESADTAGEQVVQVNVQMFPFTKDVGRRTGS